MLQSGNTGQPGVSAEEIIATDDEQQIFEIINDAALKYKGIIPADRWHEPYMPPDELRREMKRMTFYGFREQGRLLGVIGNQPVKDTTLVRHLYVLTRSQGRGIGSKLLKYVQQSVSTEYLLVGTWQAASWAIAFYRGHGFEMASNKDELLRTYWDIPVRQIEASCVLCKKIP